MGADGALSDSYLFLTAAFSALSKNIKKSIIMQLNLFAADITTNQFFTTFSR